MISITGKKWHEKKSNKNLVNKIKQDYNFSEILSKLIISRNFGQNEIDSIENDLNLTNVFSNNTDFNQSIDLVTNAIKNKENICILGDYDVDGIVSTSLLVKFFDYIKQPYFYYIPDRIKDGYGPSLDTFQKLIDKNVTIITDAIIKKTPFFNF